MKYTTPVMKICGQPSQLHWHLSKNHPLLPPPPAPLVPLATPAVAVWCLVVCVARSLETSLVLVVLNPGTRDGTILKWHQQ